MTRDTFVDDRLPPPEQLPEFLLDGFACSARLNAAVALLVGEERIAIVNAAGRWTLAEVRDRSDRLARLLVEKEGLVPGARVLLRGPSTAFMFVAWFAVLKAAASWSPPCRCCARARPPRSSTSRGPPSRSSTAARPSICPV